MGISMMMFVLTGLFIIGTYWTIEEDELAVQKTILEQQEEDAPVEVVGRRSSIDDSAGGVR